MESKKTKRLIAGASATILSLTLTGCGTQASLPEQPDTDDCSDWEFDGDLGVWECDDDDSDYYGHYFLHGKRYKSKSSLVKSSAYSQYKSSSTYKNATSKSGFGSGTTGGFGG
ncbi:aminotransferase yhxA [Bacillus solitudinis]|uniref:aminotransferase yhxA n=1 Tax=Bacillus solitudinis TaxID=2014074 RepID=UPI000C24D0CA|nr:aminotransferase yhxA [Bacillus solitudinis]